MSFPTYTDLVGNTFADINGSGLTHRHWMGAVGDFLDADTVVTAPASSARNVIQSSTDATELTLKPFAGQTAPTFLIESDAAQTDIRKVLWPDNSEMETVETINADTAYWSLSSPSGTSEVAVGATDGSGFPETSMDLIVGGLHCIVFHAYVDTNPPDSETKFQITAQSGQVLPVFNLYDFGSISRLRMLPTGQVISNAHAAPADAALNNSDFATWLDDTPGATKLMIKSKDSAGTVRTGSINLT